MDIKTFENNTGSVFFRAAGHPLAAERVPQLLSELAKFRRIALYDPEGYLADFAALYDLSPLKIAAVFVHRIESLGATCRVNGADYSLQLVDRLIDGDYDAVWAIDFDHQKRLAQLAPYLPKSKTDTNSKPNAVVPFLSLESIKLPTEFLTVHYNYLDKLNFAADFILFREGGGWHSRVVTTNYWYGHGGKSVRLWLRLFDMEGGVLATKTLVLDDHNGSVVLDSQTLFADQPQLVAQGFSGSLFCHAIGARGHDVIKYALDTYSDDQGKISCTHDSNPFPADYYAGLPAPDSGETVRVWLQNCHPTTIAANTIAFNRMGEDGESATVSYPHAIAGFATLAIDIASLFPEAKWPEQYELHGRRHFGRPRYEVTTASGYRYIAHMNVERIDTVADPALARISYNSRNHSRDKVGKSLKTVAEGGVTLGKGYILPAPVLSLAEWQSVILPTPMARSQKQLPLALALYSRDGREILRQPLGALPRNHATLIEASRLFIEAGGKDYGHSELFYDFASVDDATAAAATSGADGWLHALFRFNRIGGDGKISPQQESADTSFGAHIYNIPFTWKSEPQSYMGKPPGLSTRLFLRLDNRCDATGKPLNDTICHLIYPSSTAQIEGRGWHSHSDTHILLHNGKGEKIAETRLKIPQSGSEFFRYSQIFNAKERGTAESNGSQPYILVRDTSCRLFGFHGIVNSSGGFALDHMFGF